MDNWIKTLIIGLCIVAFIWFTGWRGLLGFCIGTALTAYWMMTDNAILVTAYKTMDKLIREFKL